MPWPALCTALELTPPGSAAFLRPIAMTTESVNPQAPMSRPGGPKASNRYILLALAVVAVVAAVYLLKQSRQPPSPLAPTSDTAADSLAGMMPGDTAVMQDVMHQIAHIKGVLARDSGNYDAWLSLGNLYFDANKPDEAIIHYRRALAIRPGDPDVLTDLATMEREAGRPDSAVAILRGVLAADSMRMQSWFNLGVIYRFDLKQPREAVAAWKKFLSLNPPREHADAIRQEIEQLEKESSP